ncbi:MAG: glycosyltransferase family 2 protein [Crocinitomicaceae bacterium]|nr:glycosyltransferase family 2 protein [Crocinitomicaceae bacterium]
MKISVVSPIYYGEAHLNELVERTETHLLSLGVEFEIILVEDGSPDNSWDKMVEIAELNKNVKLIRMSRNFGQHYAITAGLAHATGDWVVVMDCDLQDQPEEIGALLNKMQEGFDIVFARRAVRKDGFLKKLSSRIFYKFFAFLTDTEQDEAIANFGIYNKKVIAAILSMKDKIKYFPTMSKWVGFNATSIDVEHSSREDTKSSYNLRKLFKLAFDNIISFSNKPLRLTVSFGLMISAISFLFGAYYLVLYFRGEIVVLGYASLIISIWFLSGLIIFFLGVFGLYLAKIFDSVKDRPVFIVSEKINFED